MSFIIKKENPAHGGAQTRGIRLISTEHPEVHLKSSGTVLVATGQTTPWCGSFRLSATLSPHKHYFGNDLFRCNL